MIVLLRRSAVNSIATVLILFLAAGLVPAAFDETVSGRAVVGVPESLFNYLQPYYSSFKTMHSDAVIEFCVVSDSEDEWPTQLPPVHAWLVPETSVVPLQSRFEEAFCCGLTASDSFYARFVPVVSAFNPTEVISSEALCMAMAGEITDWESFEPTWQGKIKVATYESNPAESLAPIDHILHAGSNAGRPSAGIVSHARFRNFEEFANYLRVEPFSIGLIPLSLIVPGTNPVRVMGADFVSDGHLIRRVCVLEPLDRSLFGSLLRRIWQRLGHVRVLEAFIDHVRKTDAALSGSRHVTLAAVGDVMLDRGVRLAMNEYGLTYPFEKTSEVLSSADIAFANLETPISDRGNPLNMFRAFPDVVTTLRYSGLDVVSIANNHILDYDDIAMFDTIRYLESIGIQHVGAGRDETAARRYAVFDLGGMRVAFLAYTELWFCYTKDNRRYDATKSSPGVAPLREDVLLADITKTRKESDFVVVSCHWGEEYKRHPNETQRRFADLATAAGASLVLGHHPHVLQGIEFGDRWVAAYSLGNFVFDQRQPGTQESVILRFTIARDFGISRIVRTDVLPCYISNCQPVLLTGEAKSRALLEMSRLSSALVREASREASQQ